MPTSRRRPVRQRPPSRFTWRGAPIIALLIGAGLAIGGGTALIANRIVSRPASTPTVVVAMTPPPVGSYQTPRPATPIPVDRRFSTARPAQMTPEPAPPPTPLPAPAPTPRETPTAAPTIAEETSAPQAPLVEVSAAGARPASTRAARTIAQTAAIAQMTSAPTPSIVVVAEQFVRAYLRALDRGDTAAAYTYLGGKPGEPGIVAQEAPLAKGGGLHVLSLEATPDGTASAIVRARLESRGLRYQATYYIEPFMHGPHDLVIEHVDLQKE
ncbi:hypothetical protein EPN44_10605 [bacterium]|nr:MAG: hypothetical protein EPN44_10605 [bacterium]